MIAGTGGRAARWPPALALAALFLFPFQATAQAPDTGAIPGFAASHLAGERALERRFVVVPSPDSAEAHVRWLAARPHFAGSPGAHVTAAWLARRLRALGFDVRIERYRVWLPYPLAVTVGYSSRAAPDAFGEEGVRTRAPVPARDSAFLPDTSRFLLGWTAYSAAGRAAAPAVYVNRGLAGDYDRLARLGVGVRGRVVIARYGGAYRGVKAAEAELHGAAALILYSDPADDGFVRGDTVPVGPYRPAEAIQRGTVAYLWKYTGDPLTPGRPSIPGVPRLTPAQATDLPRIPVVALAYHEAAKLLRRLGGAPVPEGWQGGLPFTYHVGPGPDSVQLEVRLDTATRTLEDVVARLPGRSPQEVILGGHYDAWLLGAADPHTGTAALLEIARGLAALHRTGWTPRRSLALAFWDGEEAGDVGSSEWVEAHAKELAARAVAYMNVDMFTAGTLDVQGSPALRDLVLSAARDVADPLTGRPLLDAMRARQEAAWEARWEGVPEAERRPFRMELGDIGAGSDWTAFLHWAGVPSLQWTMNGRGSYAVYHSALDDFDYYRAHVDSAFVYTPVFARAMGLAALRLLQADAPPFRYSLYADRIGRALDAIELENRDADGQPRLTLHFERTRALLEAMRTAARAADGASDGVALAHVERAFLDPAGLPGRPWYRHQITAPGADTGYNGVLLPAVVEAVRAGDQAALGRAVARVDAALERAMAALRAAR